MATLHASSLAIDARLAQDDQAMGEVESRFRRFPKTHRLRKSSDFARVYRGGRLLKDEYLRVYALASAGAPSPRLGLSVTKRLGRAVVRNRLKRWIREWFRAQKSQLQGFDLVIEPKPAAAALDHASLLEHLQQLISPIRPPSIRLL